MAAGERERILTAPLNRLCGELSLPAVAGLLLVGAATFADAAFVGHFAGALELGAVLVGFPITMVASATSALVGSGAAAILSRALGRDDDALVGEAYGAFAGWTLVVGGLVTALGVLAAGPLLALFGARGEMLATAIVYTRIVMAGSVFGGFVFGASFLIRGEGRVADAMVILSAGSVLNVALDAVAVGAWGLGARGAAYATLATQVATAVGTAIYLNGGRLRLGLSRWRFAAMARHAPAMFRDGAAASLLYLMAVTQQLWVFRACAAWGTPDDLVFAGAHLRLLMIALVPAWGIAMAAAPVVGMAHGAGNAPRARAALRVFVLWATLATVVVWIIANVIPELVVGTLIREPEVIAPRVWAFRLLWLSVPTLGVQLVVAAYLSSIERGGAAALIIASRNLLVLGPLAFLLPMRWGVDGVWFALVAADVASLLVCVWLLQSSAATNTESAADS